MKTAENFVLVICGIFVTSVIAHLTDKKEYFKNRPSDCTDIDIKQGNGVFKIYPEGSADGFNVYCDMTTESVNGGWTVFQRRFNGKVNFYRDWKEYREGFGSLQNEFWLGNDRLHMLTSQGKFELMITLEDFSNQNRYAKYDNVKMGDEKSKYMLTYGSYRGDAGNSLSFHKGQKFSTKDRDNNSHFQIVPPVSKGAGGIMHVIMSI
ncbi:Ficolin-1-A,Ryncolin-1,Fibrinogen C domain-containing protein 1,Tenascin-N,Angiopoietin-related protein 7,Angiopoietin-related protein 6,Ficolin-3,Fibrinogen C domain-containing protein 1-B,Fibroleukin,Fibrinogen-like protein 1,Ficolin-1,Ficolin-1-B,Tenascin-R,Ryncolin-2,Fibrinogen C domain-containing protein 1-A,Microfibril-associated glycoprotein 4,Fibrinogen-like protein A,Ryncolin-3,Ficolin-2,Fibrinogen alpha chain,Tenascin,Techylectin-5A,Ryncolin-4 [Mytilus edulis]|uniref:Fibrinogen C-terminal domain-containing protein n=1 Tax=Mytilus edulis TaxID=6550 RepID=A0A8S3RA19_MYTED|nr:Ficolin-1-A,Ryncolin-1,Fibrinogen C domain-containing protein 1,Tenascin-N,Angiopoietin-related protein 7,Angiopoietin-related protein 6,Ficolin-3,Fibrinogen C domain-containing protein 1-B,Fibroleukin,Fibrinogen-like protein 1,Ficolin-1,Ficolin-1-B,Tenascin-R,Ryncolin-2,Fibrinogen C domain-containing protein 1-A,Microfibril-associated glycoprotein 4,Fibrinogen-like protein A,Ryncolin-3,Ficolin-2,Fibrinogen alpha chain,Tenascin,Techylectin-5A,Ryncolin-4 [Mytilus edulis]